MADFTFPPVSYYFKVEVKGFSGSDTFFQEVSGIQVERDLDTIEEGGYNQYVHRVPGRLKFPNLVLKRGLIPKDSALAGWCKAWFESEFPIPGDAKKPKEISVELTEPSNDSPLITWTFQRAFPVKWSLSNLNAQENKLAIETMEFAYRSFTIS